MEGWMEGRMKLWLWVSRVPSHGGASGNAAGLSAHRAVNSAWHQVLREPSLLPGSPLTFGQAGGCSAWSSAGKQAVAGC